MQEPEYMSYVSLESDKLAGSVFARIVEKMGDFECPSEIEKVDVNECQDFSKRFLLTGIPVVVRGLIRPIHQDLSRLKKLLRVALGDVQCKSRTGRASSFARYEQETTFATTSLASFLDRMEFPTTGNCLEYIANLTIPVEFTEYVVKLREVSPYSYLDFVDPKLWLGPKGVFTPLHKDVMDNFCYHLAGKKKWTIFSPLEYTNLYMIHPDLVLMPDFAVSQVDVKNIDETLFPLYKSARRLEVTVSSGETLYLPAGWAHYVECMEDSLMINRWVNRMRSPGFLNSER